MEQYLTSHEASIAWWLFVAAFVSVALGETFGPQRALAMPNARRWAGNGLLALTHIGVYAIYPLSATMVAVLVSKSPYGLLNGPQTPFTLRFVVAVILLDLLRYGVHNLFHRIPVLWRIQQVHHSDPDWISVPLVGPVVPHLLPCTRSGARQDGDRPPGIPGRSKYEPAAFARHAVSDSNQSEQ